MFSIKKLLIFLFIFLVIPSMATAERMSFLVIDANSYLVNEAFKGLNLPGHEIKFFTFDDIRNNPQSHDFIDSSEVIIADVMMRELSEYLIKEVNFKNKRVYAVRGSQDNETLKKQGFIFDSKLREYYKYLSVENLQNLVYKVANKEFDPLISFDKVVEIPLVKLHHPDSKKSFITYSEYKKWYTSTSQYSKEKPWIGMMFFSSSLTEGQIKNVNYMIKRFEGEGFNVLPTFGRDLPVLTQFFLDENRKSRVDIVLAFTLKFYSAINDQLKSVVHDLNVPIINAINLYSISIKDWQKDPIGIPPMDVMWNIANSEITGLIEPIPLAGKKKIFDKESKRDFFVYEPINESLDLIISRIKKWISLRKKQNDKKKVAVLYYNHSQGKQNIGASYLNVFRSLELILNRMKKEGYQVEMDGRITEEALKELILKYGRNIGSWAPGELDKMLDEGKIVRLPVSTYNKWFERLPKDFKERVIKQWGRAEDSDIMIKDGKFVIPAVILGKALIMPEPSRGWGDDPMKLYHDPMLYPHHQYIAAYLWLKHEFNADAMIHLGTHATHEWLPGKQAGLSHSCPPEVLITDIPNIYPYIVDDVGEGIQAKRRGRGVIIDHLIPPLKESGIYHEYAKLYDMISSYNRSTSVNSKTVDLKFEQIRQLTEKTGILKDLDIDKFDEESMEEVEHYILELRENFMPYGLHTFGRSMEGKALDEMARCIVKQNTGINKEEVKQGLSASGPNEINNLIRGLRGEFIPSGEGNDPVRNPAALPTGKNFYGFSPDKIPSPIAWKLGQKAAEDIIKNSLKQKNKYPEKVAVVLWAVEAIRNEGINESTILYLMGLRPVWNKSGKVTGTEVISGRVLKRPRIDVLMTPSGLYRDLFPNMLLFLDKAVQKAAAQRDVENLIAKHSSQMKDKLVKSGMDEKKADEFSKIRIFTEKPGTYGTGVSELAGASGFWESDDEIAKVYENRVGYAFGMGKWGESAQEIFKENLKDVKVAIHSISSNLYGTMDNDDMFQYLGGLSLAVKKESGKTPETLISMQRTSNKIKVEDVSKTIGRELRSRYLNPKWIEGMKKEDYAGAREIDHFVEYMWGWQVTVPTAIDKTKWEQTYEVYVQDKYDLDIKEFFNKANPWAYQSITARMLESIRKEYWKADEKVKKKLAVEYATNVVQKGVACCDHTCNNPVLNQMVVNVISMPGVMSPEMVEKFKMAIEKAAGKKLEKQVENRKELQKKLLEGFVKKAKSKPKPQRTSKVKKDSHKSVEGYKMEDMNTQDETTDLTSSGVQWFASVFIMLIIGLFVYGAGRKNNIIGDKL
ncbi:cobaltochelatase CobN [Candidatus Magnetomoraceae bacterium gMMP-13]